MQKTSNQLFKFALVGVVNTAIDFAILNFLFHLGLSAYWSTFFGYTTAALVGYYLNNRWTFAHLGRQPNLKNLSQYVAISLVGLGITELIIRWLHGGVGFNLNSSKLVAVVVVFFWNYSANRAITFRPDSPASQI